MHQLTLTNCHYFVILYMYPQNLLHTCSNDVNFGDILKVHADSKTIFYANKCRGDMIMYRQAPLNF